MARAEDTCPGLGQGEVVSEKSLVKLGKEIMSELEEYRKIVSYWNHQEKVEQRDPTLLVMTFFEEAKLSSP